MRVCRRQPPRHARTLDVPPAEAAVAPAAPTAARARAAAATRPASAAGAVRCLHPWRVGPAGAGVSAPRGRRARDARGARACRAARARRAHCLGGSRTPGRRRRRRQRLRGRGALHVAPQRGLKPACSACSACTGLPAGRAARRAAGGSAPPLIGPLAPRATRGHPLLLHHRQCRIRPPDGPLGRSLPPQRTPRQAWRPALVLRLLCPSLLEGQARRPGCRAIRSGPPFPRATRVVPCGRAPAARPAAPARTPVG
jgi:hypothetical protein